MASVSNGQKMLTIKVFTKNAPILPDAIIQAARAGISIVA